MADKLLKSIKFPTLPDRYVIGDSTLTEEGAAADAKAVGEALATKADTKGTYEDLIVGGAEQLMSDEYETDKDPYLFRPTGGSADAGNREYLDKIVGGTVGWNQLAPKFIEQTVTSDGITFSVANDGRITISGTASSRASIGSNITIANVVSGHKYLLNGMNHVSFHSTDWSFDTAGNANGTVVNATSTGDLYMTVEVLGAGHTGIELNGDFYPQVHDLTALFNPTIADYIYSLEQSQAGAGVAWFRNYFPKDYYPYDPGTLRSVEGVSAHETVGFNQWDEEWELGDISGTTGQPTPSDGYFRTTNYTEIIGGATYYCKVPGPTWIHGYDADKNYIRLSSAGYRYITSSMQISLPYEVKYIKFVTGGTVYNNDICINLSDPTRNGEYEPYQKHTYPLDSSLTLRGTPKLVDGKLAFDGDVYQPSGEVQRRYGLRAYQSGDESLADAITDGTNTVYKLSTPTTETAEGYEQYQICDPSGTEEFVTTGIVPVGHETRYPHDLKKKIETAPDSPSADGTYLMKRSGGKNTYMALPSTPSANGAYVLTVTVSGGNATYSWTKKE